jgi:hypothetical protein
VQCFFFKHFDCEGALSRLALDIERDVCRDMHEIGESIDMHEIGEITHNSKVPILFLHYLVLKAHFRLRKISRFFIKRF